VFSRLNLPPLSCGAQSAFELLVGRYQSIFKREELLPVEAAPDPDVQGENADCIHLVT